MGLSASQARLLLLTAKNDGLELQAQLISNERLLLSQEQELIADEYSDATSNTIYECTVDSVEARKDNGTMGTTRKGLSLATFAQANMGGKITPTKDEDEEDDDNSNNNDNTNSSSAVGTNEGTTNRVAFSYGGVTYLAQASINTEATKDSDAYTIKYWILNNETGIEEEVSAEDSRIQALNDSSPYGIMQRSARNGLGEFYVEDTDVQKDQETGSDTKIGSGYYVRKAPESLASTASRYYTEDDAEAQAKYNSAMNRVNALDKRLENKLNQVETQKKAVETEMESSEQLIKTNTERTFKYFG